MRRTVIALVALLGLGGLAEARPAYHYHHYGMVYGYRHYVPRLHLRAYHRYGVHPRHLYRHRAAGAPMAQSARGFRQAQAPAHPASSFAPSPSSVAGALVRASWYGGGERLSSHTASGERFERGGLTAAHRSLPFGTRVQVTNVQTGASVVVRINDRGPYVRGRSLDLAHGAAQAIGLSSVGQVRMVVLN
jgi:rare lipoprotein A